MTKVPDSWMMGDVEIKPQFESPEPGTMYRVAKTRNDYHPASIVVLVDSGSKVDIIGKGEVLMYIKDDFIQGHDYDDGEKFSTWFLHNERIVQLQRYAWAGITFHACLEKIE